MVVERLGKFDRVEKPGWFIAIPFLDSIRYVHDMRELTLPIQPQMATTRDNVRVEIGGMVYLKFENSFKASYGASRPLLAIIEHVRTFVYFSLPD